MTARDKALATFVSVIWGLNFLAVAIGLQHLPPFFLSALRFLLLAIPVVLFVPRPTMSWRWTIGYGLGFGTVHFGFLFLAIDQGMPAGLASLALQIAVPLTLLLGYLLLGERVTRGQVAGIVLALVGLGLIAYDRALTAALFPVLLISIAAIGWALGNLAARKAAPSDALRFTLWATVVPPIPLLAASAVIEGPTTGWVALGEAFSPSGVPGLLALLYISLFGTVVGSGIWTGLLARNQAGVVTPFSLLVPVVGLLGAWAVLGERPTLLAVAGGVLIVGGVALGLPRPAVVVTTAR